MEIKNLKDDPVIKAFLDDLDNKVAQCKAFQEKLIEARKKIVAERDLKADAYTPRTAY